MKQASRQITSRDLCLDPNSGYERELFRWFLASFLFGKHIQQDVARSAFETLIRARLDTPQRILNAGWGRLVEKLDEGRYVRYDYSTASYLLDACRLLMDKYQGRMTRLFAESANRRDLEKRLDELKGVGAKTIEIFLRDIKDPMSLAGRAAA